MSIYSGFPTRKDEQKYNGLLSKLIVTLQNHLLQFIREAVPQSKVTTYSRIIAKMKDYEEHKYLPPKFTQLLDPLCKVMGISAAIQQKIASIAQNQNYNCSVQKVKVSTQSLQKYRVKPHYQAGDGEVHEAKNRADSLFQIKNSGNETSTSKKSQFQSSFELKQRKLNYNNVLPPKDQRLKSQYDDSAEQCQKWTALGQTKTTKGGLVNKLKSNLRYKPLHPFQDAHQNPKKTIKQEGMANSRKLQTPQLHHVQ